MYTGISSNPDFKPIVLILERGISSVIGKEPWNNFNNKKLLLRFWEYHLRTLTLFCLVQSITKYNSFRLSYVCVTQTTHCGKLNPNLMFSISFIVKSDFVCSFVKLYLLLWKFSPVYFLLLKCIYMILVLVKWLAISFLILLFKEDF